jgi:hypothetical protein
MNDEVLNWISSQTAEELVKAWIDSRGVVFDGSEKFILKSPEAKNAIKNLKHLESYTDELKRILLLNT